MPAQRMSMRNIREILRLRFEHSRSHKDIGLSVNKSSSAVGEMLARFGDAGLEWPAADALSDDELESALYAPKPRCPAELPPTPDWAYVDRELRRRDFHLTRRELWREYKQSHPNGWEYSWFCRELEKWRETIDPVMRQEHKFGDKCFVDFAGDTFPIVDATTGEVTQAQIFVAVLGASNYTFVKALRSQRLPDWIAAHVEMLAFFGGCPAALVPDNYRGAVSKAEYYEPAINPTYHEMAKHYELAVLPARKRSPTDKAKVEAGVLIVERLVLAPLRNRVFYDLCSLNEALDAQQLKLNQRPFEKLVGCRQDVFDRHERPELRPLPTHPYDLGLWKRALVHIDYHVQVDGHYYSVHYSLVRQHVETRVTVSIVEIYHQNLRVASHRRSYIKGGYTTLREHMPPNHQAVHDWTPEKMLEWSGRVGPFTRQAVEVLLGQREHPEQGVRSCLGLLSLKGKFSPSRLEDACQLALSNESGGIYSYKTVRNILERNLDLAPDLPVTPIASAGVHENIRGAEYYAQAGAAC